jgi:hypothetical protein
MPEIWKDVQGYETHYEISDLGQLRSKERDAPCKGGKTRRVKAALKKLFLNKRGYQITTLSLNGNLATFTVHQLVAQAHIPGFIKGTEINHKDGVKTNNAVRNLEISNPSHNQLHAVANGLKPKTGTSSQYANVSYINNPAAKAKWAACIRHGGNSSYGWKTFTTEEEAARHVDWLIDSIGDTQRKRNFPSIP